MAHCAADRKGIVVTTIELLTPEICREALRRFWDDQTDVAASSRGVALALPLMYPDGWQVQVFLERLSQSCAVITDKGRTLARLQEQGVNFDAGQTGSLLEERKKTFDLQQDGFELLREIRLPLDGLDVQLFAESLVSVAHLVYRYEPYTSPESAADRTLQEVFKERQWQPRKNVEVDGEIEKRIRVDYLIETKRPVACQVVRRRAPLLPYMEQWGFRWSDIHKRNPGLWRAMVYDPDKQEWEETALRIGKEVCELFCPYFETAVIHEFLGKAAKDN
jgi:hypothetical protein